MVELWKLWHMSMQPARASSVISMSSRNRDATAWRASSGQLLREKKLGKVCECWQQVSTYTIQPKVCGQVTIPISCYMNLHSQGRIDCLVSWLIFTTVTKHKDLTVTSHNSQSIPHIHAQPFPNRRRKSGVKKVNVSQSWRLFTIIKTSLSLEWPFH